ncbi:LysR family transcriptional regulator [Streptomyces sp. DHE17-7]|uniref:LysR family transcriptional regulator n=1 Tax=Streptomyces sp. DHE17-7 TaxID=2759949 RepID=UPI0022EADF57|nr:LysR family transcriptional regulator [Streptomyces sp. DHE17-7]
MEIRQLRHFMAVVTEGSFTAAARRELIVQSALSTSVRNLERELGADLFDRTGRRVVLTEAGRALLPRARALLAGAEEARHAVADVAGLATGRVAIGTIQTLTCVDLPAELATFHRRFPGVQVSVRDAPVGELTEALRAGELDLAYLVPDAGDLPEGLTPYATWQEELVLITAPDHPLATAGRTLIRDLADEPFGASVPRRSLETACGGGAHCVGALGYWRRDADRAAGGSGAGRDRRGVRAAPDRRARGAAVCGDPAAGAGPDRTFLAGGGAGARIPAGGPPVTHRGRVGARPSAGCRVRRLAACRPSGVQVDKWCTEPKW